MAQGSRVLTLRILQAIWNAKNPSLIDELYSNACVIHTPDGEVHGVAGDPGRGRCRLLLTHGAR
jgi:hypothetical protein